MKKHTMVMTAMMAIGSIHRGLAQSLPAADASSKSRAYDCKADKARVNLLVALRSENQGLTESAMMRVAEIKMLCPGNNMAEIKGIIDSLSVHANVPSIRYKAYLASNVCDNPELFVKEGNINSEDEFFTSVDAELHERILGSRTN